MAYLNFSEALMEAKRRAQLQGRPISQQEVSGISEGFAKSAAEKNIQEESLTAQKSQFAETLTQRKYETQKQLEAAQWAREAEEKDRREKRAQTVFQGIGSVAGGIVGGYVGSTVPAIGTYAGAMGGAMIGSTLGGSAYQLDPFKRQFTSAVNSCIIVSACTSPDSLEVQIAREYRDRFMEEEILTGYYLLCPPMVKMIQKYPIFKSMIKTGLVDRLFDFGGWRLGYHTKRNLWTSWVISKLFLGLCRLLGKGVNRILEAQ